MCQHCKSESPSIYDTNPPQIAGHGQSLLPFILSGDFVPRIEVRDSDGKVITLPCTRCDDRFSPDELRAHSQTQGNLCEECRCECSECRDVYARDDADLKTAYDGDAHRFQHREKRVCKACCWRCADCDDYFYGDGGTNADENKVCCSCADSYVSCENCQAVVHNDHSIFIEEDDSCYCEACGARRQQEIDDESTDDDSDDDTREDVPPVSDRLIRGYTHKPSAQFFGADVTDKSQEFFGLEIETERTSRCSLSHDDSIRQCGIAADECLYVKKDGSLDDGFEIVTHPGTFKYWMSRDFSFCERLFAYGYDSFAANCGLHIHVSRSAVTPAQLAKLLIFTKQNELLMRRLSRRVSSEQLDHYAPIESARTGIIIGKVTGYDSPPTARYAAINLQNDATIEFRLFQGTLVPHDIRRNIALVAALLAFARQASLTQLTGEDFRDYLVRHGRKAIGREMASGLIRWIDNLVASSIAA